MKPFQFNIADLRISRQAKMYVRQTLDANRLSYGDFTERFERELARLHHRTFACISNSGTSGLQVSLAAMKELYGWHDGDEVLVPAVTFIASSNTILHNNLKPVFVDVEPDYFCIDPTKIEENITSRTRAIMPVHLFGQSADMRPIMKLAKTYNLKVVEDACETMFVSYAGKPVGSMGDIAVFSTYIAHIVVTGVGGMAVTNDEKLATLMKSLNFHGRDNIYMRLEDDDGVTDPRHLNALIERRFQFEHVGFSYRLTEMEAALGVAELERKDEIISGRQQVATAMIEALSDYSAYLQLPQTRPDAEHIYMLFPIILKDPRIKLSHLLLYLEEHGVETRLFMPLLTQPIYKKLFGDIQSQYPVATHLVNRGFIIGSHAYITKKDIATLKKLFKHYFAHL